MTTTASRRTAAAAVAGLLLTGTAGGLAPAPAEAAYPGVSGRIFFQSDRDGNPHIYSMNPDGSRLARLTSEGANTSPALSPDGTRLAFIHDGDVWTMGIDGGDRLRVTATPAAEATPVWSPDATRIARGQGGRWHGRGDPGPVVRRHGGATQLTDNASRTPTRPGRRPCPGGRTG